MCGQTRQGTQRGGKLDLVIANLGHMQEFGPMGCGTRFGHQMVLFIANAF